MRFHIFRPLKKNIHSDYWFLIVNPMAGASRLKAEWPKMESKLTSVGLLFTYEFTKSKGHAGSLAQSALQQGYRKIAGVGGDGTNNEIINGIISQSQIPLDKIYYSLLPFGTGNDWSRTHEIPRKIKDWVAMLKGNQQIDHNIGLLELKNHDSIQKRYFINVAGMAFDAHIVKMGERFPQKSRRKFLYLWLILRWIWTFSSPLLKVEFENQTRSKKFYTINCGVCKYAGGGMKIVPHADPENKQLAITMIKDFSKWKVPFDTPKLFSGNLKNHKHTEMVFSKKIKVSSVKNDLLEIETDGEYIGAGEVFISLYHQSIKVIVPKTN